MTIMPASGIASKYSFDMLILHTQDMHSSNIEPCFLQWATTEEKGYHSSGQQSPERLPLTDLLQRTVSLFTKHLAHTESILFQFTWVAQ